MSPTGRPKRRPLRPVHLDMTPLVDLGFLLITFFLLTTHLIDQRMMDLQVPRPGSAAATENTLTILLDQHGRRSGYQGPFGEHAQLQNLEGRSLRNSLRHFRALSANATVEPICIVKADEGVRYQQVVTAIDEIQLAGIERFTVEDSITSSERRLWATTHPR